MAANAAAPIPSRWLAEAVAAAFPGAAPSAAVAMATDASARRFWRVALDRRGDRAPATAIVMDLGDNDLPRYARALSLFPRPPAEPLFLNVHRFLARLGVAVPVLYHASPGERLILLEDVGDVSLCTAAVEAGCEDAAGLYRAAIDELMLFHVAGTRRNDPRCCAFAIAYDERLFSWELEEFLEFGIARVARGFDRAAVTAELHGLAHRVGTLERELSHRDFHGRNLFVQRDDSGSVRIRVLDFQDALMAPPAQDLAVLLTTRDAADVITPQLERRLLLYYLGGRQRRGAPIADADAFFENYRLCVLQHALKVIGRFVHLEQEGHSGYARYLTYALSQARRMLAAERGGFAGLRAALAV